MRLGVKQNVLWFVLSACELKIELDCSVFKWVELRKNQTCGALLLSQSVIQFWFFLISFFLSLDRSL